MIIEQYQNEELDIDIYTLTFIAIYRVFVHITRQGRKLPSHHKDVALEPSPFHS